MKKLHKAIKERKQLLKQGFKNVYIVYNYLSNYYQVMLFSKQFIENKFNKFCDIVI
jgi:hypothetical protein